MKVKPETATAVIELLMIGGKKPETCLAVNKCQDNKLGNCCIRLVDLFELLSSSVRPLSEELVLVSPAIGNLSRFHIVLLDAGSAGLRGETASVFELPSTLRVNDKTNAKIGYRGFEQNAAFPTNTVYIITYIIYINERTRGTKDVMTE
jgi:hypothetical protein